MANMGHCRFENTYEDLLDCQEKLQEYSSIKECEEEVNEYEKAYVKKLVRLCSEIAEEFWEED